MTTTELKFVVWEWMNDNHKWSSYSPEICHLLERTHERGLNLVCLGDVDSRLKSYSVNLREFQQISEVTGYRRAVRRKLFNSDSIAACGISWQWAGDRLDQWIIFDTDLATSIENSYSKGLTYINLNDINPGYFYTIDFTTMAQRNNRTGFLRSVRRIQTSSYPLMRHPAKSTLTNHTEDNLPLQSSSSSNECSSEKSESTIKSKSHSPKKGFIKQFTNLANKIAKLASNNDQNEQELISDGDTEKSLDRSVDAASLETPLCDKKSTSSRKETRGRKKCKHQSKGAASKSLKTQSKESPKTTFQSPLSSDEIKPVPGVKPPKTIRNSANGEELSSVSLDADEIIAQFCAVQNSSSVKEDCIICCEHLSNPSPYDDDNSVVSLKSCHHEFHMACIKAMYNSNAQDGHLQCPTCKMIYGVKRGNQPRGTMDFYVRPDSLPGYSKCDTICISYNIPPGIQGPEHPHPGRRYTARGFPRVCYLPNNKKGRQVLQLLVKAWERRLLFTVGSSATTGEEDTVTWNEIHHKTEFYSNHSGHGWPDPHYLDNVLMELAMQGVVK